MSDAPANPALDTKVTTINPTGRGGWVAVAVATIMLWEGFAPVGHHDRIDPPGVNTIGYGHIEHVHIGDRVTKIEAGQLLADDLPIYEAQVEKCIHVPMPGYRHGAVVSFDYNVGGGALCKSSVARYINAGEWQKGCDALLLYVKSDGQFRQGLLNRREAERKLCYNQNEPPLPAAEVMAQPRVNVDQKTADAEVAKLKNVKLPRPRPVEAPPQLPPQAPPSHWYSRLVAWLMEK